MIKTRQHVNARMNAPGINGRQVADLPGPNGSSLEFWVVGGQVVIVQYWPEGGCTHYMPSPDITWKGFEVDLERLADAGRHPLPDSIQEALNSGDGTYRP